MIKMIKHALCSSQKNIHGLGLISKTFILSQFDLAYIDNDKTFPTGFVRTIAMRFFKGYIGLNEKWAEAITLAVNATNNTNITSLDDYPNGTMIGEPLIGLFDPEFDEGKRGVSETPYFSTMVEVRK